MRHISSGQFATMYRSLMVANRKQGKSLDTSTDGFKDMCITRSQFFDLCNNIQRKTMDVSAWHHEAKFKQFIKTNIEVNKQQ